MDTKSASSSSFKPAGTENGELYVKVLAGNVLLFFFSAVEIMQMLPYITSCNGSGELGGFLGEIWSILEVALKFKSNVTSLQFDDAEQSLSKGDGDVMLYASVAFKSEHFYFSQPLILNWYHLYMKKPIARASSARYLKTFDNHLWTATLLFLIFFMILLWTNAKITSRYNNRQNTLSIPVCYFAVIGGFLNQGYDPKIKSISGRIVLFTALLFGFVLFSAMNAILVAQLAVFNFELPFKNLGDIARKGTHSLCVRESNYVYKNFVNDNGSLLPMWTGVMNGPRCLDMEDQANIPKLLCRDGAVILENRVIVFGVTSRHGLPCDIAALEKKLFKRGNLLIFNKKFVLKDKIAKFLTKLKNYGILQRIERNWVGFKIENNKQQTTSAVTLNHIFGILMFFLSMVMFSVIILLIEIITHQETIDKVTKIMCN